jgi:hypothetical protein
MLAVIMPIINATIKRRPVELLIFLIEAMNI